jgi:hypothetical protein
MSRGNSGPACPPLLSSITARLRPARLETRSRAWLARPVPAAGRTRPHPPPRHLMAGAPATGHDRNVRRFGSCPKPALPDHHHFLGLIPELKEVDAALDRFRLPAQLTVASGRVHSHGVSGPVQAAPGCIGCRARSSYRRQPGGSPARASSPNSAGLSLNSRWRLTGIRLSVYCDAAVTSSINVLSTH